MVCCQALSEVFKGTDSSEAATQIRVKNASQKDRSVEIEYRAAQTCDNPSPMALADEISKQVQTGSHPLYTCAFTNHKLRLCFLTLTLH